jgi:multimeric flavodoxin WrbA
MKIVALMGSHRVGSNTDVIMDKVLEGAREAGAKTKKFNVCFGSPRQ